MPPPREQIEEYLKLVSEKEELIKKLSTETDILKGQLDSKNIETQLKLEALQKKLEESLSTISDKDQLAKRLTQQLTKAKESKNLTSFYRKLWGIDLYNIEDTRFVLETPDSNKFQILIFDWRYKALVFDQECKYNGKNSAGTFKMYRTYSLWSYQGPKIVNGECVTEDKVSRYRALYERWQDTRFNEQYSDFKDMKEGVLYQGKKTHRTNALIHRTNVNRGSFKFFDKENPFPYFFIGGNEKAGIDDWKIRNTSPIYWSTKDLRFSYNKEDDKFVEIKTYKDYKRVLSIS